MRLRNEYGLWIATFKCKDGTICMGFDAKMRSAMIYCADLIQARHAEMEAFWEEQGIEPGERGFKQGGMHKGMKGQGARHNYAQDGGCPMMG